MPGLVAVAGGNRPPAEPLGEMVDALLHFPHHESTTATSPLGGFASVHLGVFDHRIHTSTDDGSVGLVLDGWVRSGAGPGGDPGDAAQACLDAYLAEGNAFVRRLNGEFNLAVWDLRTRTVTIATDRYGLRPLQYGVADGTLFVAPEAKAIFAAGGLAARLDPDMVLTYLSIGRVHLGDHTFFAGVRTLPPGSILTWTAGSCSIDRYWDFRFDPLPTIDDDFVDELVVAFRRGVERRLPRGRRFAVALSGGLDSRMVAAALAATGATPVTALTFGIPGSDEARLAQQVAEVLGLPWHFEELRPADFLRHARRGVEITEGLDLFVQSYAMELYPRVREFADVAFTGLALDLTLGGSHIDPDTVGDPARDGDPLAGLERTLRYFPDELVAAMFGSRDAPARASALLRATWQPELGEPLADSTDRFLLRYRVHRVVAMRQYWQRLFVEDAAPTFDNAFVDLVLRIPANQRAGHRVYQRFMSRLCPELAGIRYQRTGLPADAPVEFWDRSIRLEAERERLHQDIWSATRGQVVVPSTRYATDYTEWLRSDPAWLSWVRDLIGGDDCRLPSAGVQLDPVRALLSEHLAGRRDHRVRILQLVTLELFMRQYFP